MSILYRFIRRVRYLLHRASIERERDEERRFHIEMETEDMIRSGMSRSGARRAAIAAFGTTPKHKQVATDKQRVWFLADLVQDVRYAVRVLTSNPGFSSVTVLTLGFGIAATAVLLSIVQTLVFQQLPVQNPDRLYVLDERWESFRAQRETRPAYPFGHYLDLDNRSEHVFTGVGAYALGEFSVRVGDQPSILTGASVSSNYFSVMGIRPALGRFFQTGPRGTWHAIPEIVLGHDYWQHQFAGDSAVLGQTILVNSRPLVVVGVAPRGFRGSTMWMTEDAWFPVGALREDWTAPPTTILTIFGRLPPNVFREQAEAALTSLAPDLSTGHVRSRVIEIRLIPMTAVTPDTRAGLFAFLGVLTIATALVLLVIVTNVAGLLLARSIDRRGEISLRMSMGASRARVMKQLLTETVLVSLLGAALGVLAAVWIFSLLPALQLPTSAWHVDLDLHVDPTVLFLTICAAVALGVLIGLEPARHGTRLDLASRLRMTEVGSPRGHTHLRTAFVVTQIALSAALLATSTLFASAVERGWRMDLGFDPNGVAIVSIDLTSHGYDGTRRSIFFRDLVERLSIRPEVAAAGLGRFTPFSGSRAAHDVSLDGGEPDGRSIYVGRSYVDTGYFEATGTSIIEGRIFDAVETSGVTTEAVINETFATRAWPGESPLGRTISIGGLDRIVVGVVTAGTFVDFGESARAHAYVPLFKEDRSKMLVYTRARGSIPDALRAVREEVATLDRNVAFGFAQPLSDMVGFSLMHLRIAAWFVGVFGLVGLGVAALGVYAVFAYQVAARTREFGIRLALGALGTTLTRDVLTRAASIIATATALGVLLSMGLARVIRGFLFGFGGAEVVVVFAVCMLLGLVAVFASYLPARRAARVDPMVSLRL